MGPIRAIAGPDTRLAIVSGGQVTATVVASIGGLAMWALAARLFDAVAVGVASQVVSLGALLSSVTAAGAGQYLLSVLPQQTNTRRRALLAITSANALTIIAASVVGAAVLSRPDLVIATAAYGLAVSATSVQDAAYIWAASARDIAAKALAISLCRLAFLVGLGPVLIGVGMSGYQPLLVLIVVPHLMVAAYWLIVRLPRHLQDRPGPTPRGHHIRTRSGVIVAYSYSLSLAMLMWGIPALITNTLVPESAGSFYVAWLIGSLVAALPASLANALLGSASGVGWGNAPPLLLRQFMLVVVGGAALIALTPLFAAVFGNRYDAIASMLPFLVVGHAASGAGLIIVALLRRLAGVSSVLAGIALWLLGTTVAPGTVAVTAGSSLFLIAFACGALASAATLVVLAVTVRSREPRGSAA